MLNRLNVLLILLLLAVLAAACQRAEPQVLPGPASSEEAVPSSPADPDGSSPVPSLSPTPFQPSSTPVPLAARVNGEGISLAQFQAEASRYTAAVSTEMSPEDDQRVLDGLIDAVLLAQGAAEAGFSLTEAELDARLEALAAQLGGDQALVEWMAANGYSETDFRSELRQSLAAAWMRDQIAAGVPETAEQVRARQILLRTAEEGNGVRARLEAGESFASLAAEFDPVAEGELGWFPRGYLLAPELEEAAFGLQPDQYAGPVETATGFGFVQVIERDPQRPLEPDARQALQSGAVLDWLADRRENSTIEIFP